MVKIHNLAEIVLSARERNRRVEERRRIDLEKREKLAKCAMAPLEVFFNYYTKIIKPNDLEDFDSLKSSTTDASTNTYDSKFKCSICLDHFGNATCVGGGTCGRTCVCDGGQLEKIVILMHCGHVLHKSCNEARPKLKGCPVCRQIVCNSKEVFF